MTEEAKADAPERIWHYGALQIALQAGFWFDRKNLTLPEREMKVADLISGFAEDILADSYDKLEQHHELCLGVMAVCYPHVSDDLKQSIREGIEAAMQLGFPVSTRNLEQGGPLFTGGRA